MRSARILKTGLRILGVVALSLGLAFLLFHVVFQPFQVSGMSMAPTLRNGDYLLVDRLLFSRQRLARGSLVVFSLREGGPFLVKRLAAFPGETIAIRDKTLRVDGRKRHLRIAYSTPENFGPCTVPAGRCFLLGDNPSASYDSRSFGPVPLSRLYGRVVVRYLPLVRASLSPGNGLPLPTRGGVSPEGRKLP